MHYSHMAGAIAILLGCTLATSAFAASQPKAVLFSYNYLQIAFVDLDSDYDGFKLDGSFDVSRNLTLTATYMNTDSGAYHDYDLFTLGLAYHQRLVDLPSSDIVIHGEFERASRDNRHNNHLHSNDESGLGFGAMLRHQAQRNIELFGDLTYSSLYDNDLALTAGVNLTLNQRFSVVAAVELSDDDMLLLGLRMQLK